MEGGIGEEDNEVVVGFDGKGDRGEMWRVGPVFVLSPHKTLVIVAVEPRGIKLTT